jgi:hypothetical protein
MSELSTAARPPASRLCELARRHLESGDRIRGIDLCREALAIDPACTDAHVLLAAAALAGEDYLRMLERIQRHLRPRAYLEIGVGDGRSLALAGEGTLAVGVDPEPQLAQPLKPAARLFRETSDHFFGNRDVRAELGGRPPDLVFIDGLHLFEQALRDFINAERHGAPHTVVLLHDCYPLDEPTASRERRTDFWTGDVWKLVLCLKKHRPDLAVHTLSALPTGLGVVRRLDPGSRVLAERFDALCREYVPLPYAALGEDKRAALNLVPSDWGTALGLLGR